MLICTFLGLLVAGRGVSRADGIEITVDTATRLEGSWRLSAGAYAQAEARRGQEWMIFDLVPENLLQCRRYSDPPGPFVEFRDGFGMSWDPTPEPDWVGRTPVYYATAWAEFTPLSGTYYPRLTGGPDVEWEFWDVRWEGEGSEFSGRFRFVAVPVPWQGEVKWRKPVANAVFSAPTPIVLEASVSVQVGTVAFVRFFSGTTLLGSVEEPPFLIRWKHAPEGEHELVASAVDDRNQERATDRVHIMVGPSTGEPAREVRVLDAVVGEAPEASTSLRFEVSLSKSSSEPVTVRYETVAGSATAGTDYLGGSGTLVFEAGVTSLTVEVTVLPDEAQEPDETLVLRLSEPIGAILGRAQATGVIQDDPGEVARTVSLPILSVADTWVVVEEPGIAGAEAQFRARLSVAGSRPVRVAYTTVDGTANVTDYTPVSGTLLFPPGTTEQIVSVPVAPNALGEADEWFGLELSHPEECHLATRRATCQVSDEYPPPTEVITIVTDGPLPALSVSDATVRERIGGTTNLTFNVWLSKPASVPVEFYYVTEGDTALPEIDFVPDSGWRRIESGATNAMIPVAVLADDRSETAETLRLRLAAPEEAVLARKVGTGTIQDRYNLTPTVLLQAPTNGSTFKYGEPVTFSGLAYDPEGRIAGVEFRSAGTVISAASGSPFTANTAPLPLGRHIVSARVVDETGAASSSDDIWIEVVESSPFTWVVPPPGSTLRVGEATRLAVRLDLIDIELRQVEFFVNGQSIGAADAPILELNWTPEAADVYTIRAVGWDRGGGMWTSDPLAVSAMLAAPLNDNFAEAVSLEGFQPHVEATNEGAGREPGEPLHHAVESGGSLWYRWTSPGDGLATIRVLGPGGSPGIAGFYTGTEDGPLAPVRVITGTGTLAVTTGQGYWIMLDTFGGDRGSIQFDMVLADARWSQPADGAILAAPLDLVLQAVVNAPAEAVGEVAYFAGNELLGVATEAPFSWPWTNTPCGYHELRARVVDVLGGERISPSRRITVRPENDDFEQATVVSGHRVAIRASNEAATYQGAYVQQPPPRMDAIWIGEPRYGDNQGGHSIWYQWRAPEDGLCKVAGDIAGTGALLAVYVGARVDQLRFVGSNPFEPRGTSLLFPVTAGTNYYIAFDGLFSEEGPIAGGIELHPMNDDFERRVRVGSDRFEAIASHRGASLEGAVEAAQLGNAQEVSVWWEWTPPNSGIARVVCQSEGGSTRLAVFTGDELSQLVLLTSSADAPSNPALVTFAAEAGVAYQIAVLGGPGASADFTVRFVQPRLRIVSPLNGSAHPEPASLELAAAMDEGALPARVEYYLGTRLVGDASSPPFAVSIRDLPAGTYALTGVGRFASGVTSISLPSSFLVYRDLAIPKPRIFSGPFGLASHVINALGEHRIFGRGGSGFGLRGPGEWSVPRMAQRPPGVEAWLSIQSGQNGESWALTPTGELFVNGEEAVTPPPGVGRWVALRTGPSGALLVGDDGRIYLEGRHPIDFALPGKHWTDIAAGQLYHCTLDDTGAAYMHTLDGSRPVTQAVPFPSDGVRRWVQMEGGIYVVLLKGEDGQLYEAKPFGPWGEYQATVTPVANPPGVVGWDGFAAGGFHAMAIGSDGQLYTWGRNWEGQLGIGGAGFDQTSLQKVTPPPGVTAWSAVAAGYMHSLAVGNDCALYGWGRNIEGQLGIGPIPSPTVAGRIQNVGVLCAFPIVYQDALPTVLEDGSFRLRFTSDLNRLYLIQYSADAQTWRTAVTPVLGTGAFVEWTDAGPPETETPPASVPERFYRIVFAP